MNNDKSIPVLNDLLNITNDRIAGFAKVEDKVWETHSDLRSTYDDMVSRSTDMKNDLINLINLKGGEADNSTSVSGAFHRAWIDVKNTFASDKEESTLENVVFGEKAAIDAYEDALESGDLCPESTVLVSDQLHHLKASYAKFETLESIK
ncbi:PA2169 family four-helix-bundle protein [Epilithonimonas sp. JDS]|uniref:PA2169 family four-helix-bundle protein n=1 Tax=Epilithonimonas sp. JDS TaxID=2902797 RepID=UPI001E4BC001|nr:PA2169 family four-helix-bundle protein [Epilithonimonas sp. JDS]MCD9855868.1 PA2169 family four-helix-bundle protein [Epilithonimonas sp. JDS]